MSKRKQNESASNLYGSDGLVFRFQNENIEKQTKELPPFHHALEESVGDMFRDMVKWYNGTAVKGPASYYIQKYESAMYTLSRYRTELEAEAGSDEMRDKWQKLVDTFPTMPIYLKAFATVNSSINEKKWDEVELLLSRILLAVIKEKYIQLGVLEHMTFKDATLNTEYQRIATQRTKKQTKRARN